jgi:DNA ligase-1
MRAFADLVEALDATGKTGGKLAALEAFFRDAPDPDKVWMLALFSGRRPRRAVSARTMRRLAAGRAGLPDWLVDECHGVVGDQAETLALLLPPPARPVERSLAEWMARLAEWRGLPERAREAALAEAWEELPARERFAFHKLLTGGMRLGVSQRLVLRALASATGRDAALLAQRLTGAWDPAGTTWEALLAGQAGGGEAGRPYPFFLAHALEEGPEALPGFPEAWTAEWKWDGIRAQLLWRGGRHAVWTRGEELATDAFPEFALLEGRLPDGTVLDGELLAWSADAPLPFRALQERLNRHHPGRALLRRAPVLLMAYDLLEEGGEDLRERPLRERRSRLEALVAAAGLPGVLRASPALAFAGGGELARLRASARERGAEGLMLKRADGPYRVGRPRGDWWKWKVDPLTADGVLVYAQRGSGRRANLYTDYTFAVWSGEELVPFTKAYSGLTDAEIRELDAWIRRHTRQRRGPVRMVEPRLVFELGFEGIGRSDRHRAGVALRFPRILRWRRDKPAAEADRLEDLEALLRGQPGAAAPVPRTGNLFDPPSAEGPARPPAGAPDL